MKKQELDQINEFFYRLGYEIIKISNLPVRVYNKHEQTYQSGYAILLGVCAREPEASGLAVQASKTTTASEAADC